ncbi:MAG: ATP-binding protein [Proteobacteria bacterium]|nr:ATP-binding protein [Pseudomonadota bacterium]NBP13417.1 ATP-binding protein [bacterium]
MFLSENLQKKWAAIIEHPDLPQIKDGYKKAVTAVLLENQENALREERSALFEAAPANNIGAGDTGVQKYDPILIGLVRRSMPNLMAYDICGVQPMNGPTGLIFAMRSMYGSERANTYTRVEALFNEADTDFSSGNAVVSYNGTHAGTNPGNLISGGTFTTGGGMTTAQGEALGDASTNAFAQMSFSIDKTTVTAKSRALKAEYTVELAQDLKAIHGLDAEAELSNILSQEFMFEINREVVRTIYKVAKLGSPATANAGTFDLDVDSNGRWSVERFKGLLFNIERDANHIAQDTRRGKGNIIVCSADVASALAMAGVLDYAPALSTSLNVDDTGNTFAGVLNGRYRVYIDPYSANLGATEQFYVVGYKGTSPYDAGIFYCPYVPLQMVRAVDPNSFQPKIGFKTRYGMIANPYVTTNDNSNAADADTFTSARNMYYRKTRVLNLM